MYKYEPKQNYKHIARKYLEPRVTKESKKKIK